MKLPKPQGWHIELSYMLQWLWLTTNSILTIFGLVWAFIIGITEWGIAGLDSAVMIILTLLYAFTVVYIGIYVPLYALKKLKEEKNN